MTKLFVALGSLLLVLVGVAAARDSQNRQYLSIQDQYKHDHPQDTAFDTKIQQLFPTFAAAKRGDTYRVERCISCHVPNVNTIGPEQAAQRLAQDFFRYEPDAHHLASADHLSGVHPAYIDSATYAKYGATGNGFHPYQTTSGAMAAQQATTLPGPIPAFLDPGASGSGSGTNAGNSSNPTPGNTKIGIDTVGCIVCHNGGRLALDESHAHQNYIVNPEYAFTAGAELYYKNCAVCHGNLGEGAVGPPLSNQDRLGFFNEDYYYRCIEYGFTDFEHYGSIMPAWGGTAADFVYDPSRDKQQPPKRRALSEDQIALLVQFIRHWEDYNTLP